MQLQKVVPHRRQAFGALCALVAACVATAPASAAGQLTATHGDWRIYVDNAGNDRVCYALASPTDKAPRNVDHGQIAFMIASWQSGAAREQPSFHAGYDLRPGSPTRARIGSTRFRMFADGREGFVENDDEEKNLVAAMRRSMEPLRVEAVSQRGTETAYEFSLNGVTAALQAIDSACS